MTNSMTGHCLCGAVTIHVEGAHDPRLGICHCRMCQRWTGSIFACFDADASSVTVTGDVVRYSSSAFAERVFCPTCGSHLWFRNTDEPDQPYELLPGLFDAALAFPMRSEVYSDRAMAAMAFPGEHRRTSEADYEAKNKFVEGKAQ